MEYRVRRDTAMIRARVSTKRKDRGRVRCAREACRGVLGTIRPGRVLHNAIVDWHYEMPRAFEKRGNVYRARPEAVVRSRLHGGPPRPSRSTGREHDANILVAPLNSVIDTGYTVACPACNLEQRVDYVLAQQLLGRPY